MRILFDTNVILDALMNRQPHATHALSLMALVEQGRLNGIIGATTLTTIFYLISRALDSAHALKHVRTLLEIFEVASVGRAVLSDSLELAFPDYEDAVIHESAKHAGAEGIVTRDQRGFTNATLRVYSPEELHRILDSLANS